MMARHPCMPMLLAPTHRLPRRCCIAVLIAIAGTLLSAQPNNARSGAYALRDDDKDLRIHIRNSTFPTSEGHRAQANPHAPRRPVEICHGDSVAGFGIMIVASMRAE